MKDKVIWFATPQNRIHTKNMFLANDQVFLKKDVQKVSQNEEAEWYPINFQ